MKLLVRYGKRGAMRFASHRDFARVFERALRRAQIPMAYSSGFNPHQRVSYVNPAPTGALSEAEFVVISLREVVDPADVRTRLCVAMPVGFPIIDVTPVKADQCFDASRWQVGLGGLDRGDLAGAVDSLKGLSEALVSRQTKKGIRTFDVLPPLEALRLVGADTLDMVIRQTEPLVRPDDVVSAVRAAGGLDEVTSVMTRLAQGPVADMVGLVEDAQA